MDLIEYVKRMKHDFISVDSFIKDRKYQDAERAFKVMLVTHQYHGLKDKIESGVHTGESLVFWLDQLGENLRDRGEEDIEESCKYVKVHLAQATLPDGNKY